MTTNSQVLLTTEPKQTNKQSKPLEQEENHRNGDHLEGYQQGKRKSRGKGTGIRKHNWNVQNRQGNVKNSIENGETKELIYMTYGHELRELLEGRSVPDGRGQRGKTGTTIIAQSIKYI